MAIEQILRDAGWFPGRRVPDDLLAAWLTVLERDGRFRSHQEAVSTLREFGGLQVGVSGPGRARATLDVHVDPSLVVGEEDRILGRLIELRGKGLFPLGEVGGGHSFLAMARSGEVFLVMDAVHGRWPSFTAAIESLLLGLPE